MTCAFWWYHQSSGGCFLMFYMSMAIAIVKHAKKMKPMNQRPWWQVSPKSLVDEAVSFSRCSCGNGGLENLIYFSSMYHQLTVIIHQYLFYVICQYILYVYQLVEQETLQQQLMGKRWPQTTGFQGKGTYLYSTSLYNHI